MNNKFSFNAFVLSMRIIHEVVASSFKNGLEIFLIFYYIGCIKCYQLNDRCSVYCPIAL